MEKSKSCFFGLLGSSPNDSLDIGIGFELGTHSFYNIVHDSVELDLVKMGEFRKFSSWYLFGLI